MYYSTSQFARKAAVTPRTLRYYDKVGLFSPSGHTEAGHRLYTEEDLWSLQQILALKFLGLSLEEIKICLQTDPERLQRTLATQKAMMQEKRRQIEVMIESLEKAEKFLSEGQHSWDAIIDVIQVIQMEQDKTWVNKYLTPEQQEKMAEISQKSYSPEAAQKIAEWGKNWTEEDQQRASQRWRAVFADLRRLVAAGKDPTGPEGQALAREHSSLIHAFTRGDADVEKGLKQWWQSYNQLSEPSKPVIAEYSSSKEESAFMQKALEHYQQHKH